MSVEFEQLVELLSHQQWQLHLRFPNLDINELKSQLINLRNSAGEKEQSLKILQPLAKRAIAIEHTRVECYTEVLGSLEKLDLEQGETKCRTK